MSSFDTASATSTRAGAEKATTPGPKEPAGTSWERTDATRHLCTGVYVDRAFRNLVVRKVHNDSAHRTAPSYGFDLVAVTHRAWRAWILETIQQTCQLLAVILALVLDRPAVIVAACGAGIAYLTWTGLRAAPEALRLQARAARARIFRQQGKAADHGRREERSRFLLLCGAGSAGLVLIAEMTARATHALFSQFALAAVVLGLLAGVSAVTAAVRQSILNKIHAGARLQPARLAGRLGDIAAQQECTHAIYRRQPWRAGTLGMSTDLGFEPGMFIGSGTLVNRWLPPLNVPLLRPGEGRLSDREYDVPPFGAPELVQYVKAAMRAAGQYSSQLKGFRITNRLYLAETDVGPERDFLRRPCTAGDIEKIIDDPNDAAQHYLEIQLSSTGELVTTAFLRVTIRGRSLSLDFAACALTRTPERYHVVDRYRETGTGAVVRAALHGACTSPVALGNVWRLAEAPWTLTRAAWAKKDRTLVPRRRRMIGTRLSIREEKAAEWDSAELDHTSIYDDVKIIEQRLLKATEDFLESKEVDTSDFKTRVQTIISAGILNMGKLDMNHTAIGTNAQINTGPQAPGGGGTGPAAPRQGT